jgi:hypothetical protein
MLENAALRRGRQGAEFAARGNFCRLVNAPLTIKDELFGHRNLKAALLRSACQAVGEWGRRPRRSCSVSKPVPAFRVSEEEKAMRIYGPNGAMPAAPASSARRNSSSSFSLPSPGEASDSRPATAPAGVGSIDALMALQGVEDPVERRKRAVRRGRDALDVLDDLKIGLLSGSLDQATVQRLRTAASGLKANSGDEGLDSVLAEIELRVEVELAKAGSI